MGGPSAFKEPQHPTTMKLTQLGRQGWKYARITLLALITPLLEKNPCKTKTISRCAVPVVLSMARVIVLAFAVAMIRQVVRAGIAGWPEATLCIAIVIAIPLLSALERVKAEDVLAFSKSVVQRFGQGETRTVASTYSVKPSKHDDHTDDSDQGSAVGDQPSAERSGPTALLRVVP